MAISTRIQRGMARQIHLWRDNVACRDHRLGWKVGFNRPVDQQRLDLPSLMVGYLSRDRQLTSGQSCQARPTSRLLVEPEVAILLGCTIPPGIAPTQARSAISAYAAALELVDTSRSADDDIEAILAGNLFHEAVALSADPLPSHAFSRDQLGLSLCINGSEVRTLDQDRVPQDFSTVILTVATILAANGEQLQQGDWIITGAAAQPVAVQVGDIITLDMGRLGKLSMTIA